MATDSSRIPRRRRTLGRGVRLQQSRSRCADRPFIVPPSRGSRTSMPLRAHYQRTTQPARFPAGARAPGDSCARPWHERLAHASHARLDRASRPLATAETGVAHTGKMPVPLFSGAPAGGGGALRVRGPALSAAGLRPTALSAGLLAPAGRCPLSAPPRREKPRKSLPLGGFPLWRIVGFPCRDRGEASSTPRRVPRKGNPRRRTCGAQSRGPRSPGAAGLPKGAVRRAAPCGLSAPHLLRRPPHCLTSRYGLR